MKFLFLFCLVTCLPSLINIDFSKFKNLPGKIPVAEGEREIKVVAPDSFFTPSENTTIYLTFEAPPKEKDIVKFKSGEKVLVTIMNLHFPNVYDKVRVYFKIAQEDDQSQGDKKAVKILKVYRFEQANPVPGLTVEQLKRRDLELEYAKYYINIIAFGVIPPPRPDPKLQTDESK